MESDYSTEHTKERGCVFYRGRTRKPDIPDSTAICIGPCSPEDSAEENEEILRKGHMRDPARHSPDQRGTDQDSTAHPEGIRALRDLASLARDHVKAVQDHRKQCERKSSSFTEHEENASLLMAIADYHHGSIGSSGNLISDEIIL